MKRSIRLLVFVFAAIILSTSRCSSPASVSDENIQIANNDSVLATVTDEIDDLVAVVLNNYAESGLATDGRAETLKDNRLTCPGITFDFSNVAADHSSGKLTITFPAGGCVDGLKTNIRQGSIIVTWTGGKWYMAGSTHVIAFNNYSINDVAITGSRTMTCTTFTFVSSKTLNVSWNISGIQTLTWPDGTSASFTVNKTKVWAHSSVEDIYRHTTGPNGDYAYVGTNRHGKQFNVTIGTTLVFVRSCITISKNFMPVSGTKYVTNLNNNKVLTIDYGLSACDNVYTLIVDGTKSSLRAKNNSSDD